jgi:hypothetical protein
LLLPLYTELCVLILHSGGQNSYYTPAPRRERGYTVLPLPVCPSVRPSVRPCKIVRSSVILLLPLYTMYVQCE